MSRELKQFLGGAFALIALFLVLAHAGGFATAITSGANGSAKIFQTLQGR